MADMNMKKTAFQLLVRNGILTQAEADKCIQVLSDDCDDMCSSIEVSSQSDDESFVIFEDSKICVTFEDVYRVVNMNLEEGIEFDFAVQNKTNYKMDVFAINISINGFALSDDVRAIYIDANPKEKTTGEFSLYSHALKEADITNIDDIHLLQMSVFYEIEEIDYEFESGPLKIKV